MVERPGDLTGADRPRAGRFAVELGALVRAGLPVPPAFVVCATAFAGARVWAGPPRAVLPPGLERQIRHAYERMGGEWQVPVSVRASADAPGAAIPGAQATPVRLNVIGADRVLDAVARCWAGATGGRRLGAVVVQRQVAASSSGTAAALHGEPERVRIDASLGLHDPAAAGDCWVLDAADGAIVAHESRRQRHVIEAAASGGTTTRPPTAAEARGRTLSVADLRRLARVCVQVDRLLGGRRVVEWALDGDGDVWLLGARLPETGARA